MYDPCIRKKSDECAVLYRLWYDMEYIQNDEKKAKEIRNSWGVCCIELENMISDEYRNNSKYENVRKTQQRILKKLSQDP